MQTHVPGVYAIGDVTRRLPPGPRRLARGGGGGGNDRGARSRIDYRAVPDCVYTSPESPGRPHARRRRAERHGTCASAGSRSASWAKRPPIGDRGGVRESDRGRPIRRDPRRPHDRRPRHGPDRRADARDPAWRRPSRTWSTPFHAHPTLPEAFPEASLDLWGRAIYRG